MYSFAIILQCRLSFWFRVYSLAPGKRHFTNTVDKPILRFDIFITSCGVDWGEYHRAPLMISQHWLTWCRHATSHYITETEMLLFWWNFHRWLHWKLSKWQLRQLPVQPLMKISSKWRHFRFNAEPMLTLRFILRASLPYLVVLLTGSACNNPFPYVMVISNSCLESFYSPSDIKGTNSFAVACSLQSQQSSFGCISSNEMVIMAFWRNFHYLQISSKLWNFCFHEIKRLKCPPRSSLLVELLVFQIR